MASKAYLDRQRSVLEITSLLDTRGDDVLRGLEEFFAPDLEEGEPMPDFEPFLRLAGRALKRRLRELGVDDAEWEVRCDGERAARKVLKKVTAAFRRALKKLRMLLRGLCGHQPGAMSDLGGELPRDPVGIVGTARLLFAWMDDSAPNVNADYREAHEKKMEEVEAATVEFSLAEAARVQAQSQRHRGLEAFNADFVDLADFFNASYRLAGLRQEARHLRPSKQEKGLTMNVVKRRRAARAAHAKKDDPEP